jgi:hypothetical protein
MFRVKRIPEFPNFEITGDKIKRNLQTPDSKVSIPLGSVITGIKRRRHFECAPLLIIGGQ